MAGGLGVISAFAMACLFWVIHIPAMLFMDGNVEGFEQLSAIERFLFPILATLVLIVITYFLAPSSQKVGVTFVIERLNNHQANLPILNAVVQFITASVCLVGGLSVGKEGPAVHIGATFGSFLARITKLPMIHVETLIACGIASAVSAGFQTPLAGVLFALEVILLEYRLHYILPVVLSSVVASIVSKCLLGDLDVFSFTNVALPEFSLNVYLTCLILALAIVVLTVSFFRIQKMSWSFGKLHFAIRFAFIGVLTAVLGALFPETLGAGYDSLSLLINGESLVTPLLIILLLKLLLTGVSVGLGAPGGMIGPTFLIGGLCGVQIALWMDTGIAPEVAIPLFALIGMSAMMAASFQAPLTALVAIIEMTHRSEIMLPAMLVIGVSCLIIRILFRQQSIFVERLHFTGIETQISSATRFLRQHSVQSISLPVIQLDRYMSFERIQDLSSSVVDYIVLKQLDGQMGILHRNQLLHAFECLERGPQPWLIDQGDCISLDVLNMVSFDVIPTVDVPDSLEAMLKWFNKHRFDQVLVQLPATDRLELVEKSKLYHSFLSR